MCHPWVMFLSGLSGWVVVVSRVCGLRPTVKAALNPNERFMLECRV
ncbi:hypothetical protein [Propionibacterium phage TCUCAP1]|nr:hypothetical protein [Propionibacterium phage TCUCAP1]